MHRHYENWQKDLTSAFGLAKKSKLSMVVILVSSHSVEPPNGQKGQL